MTRRNQKPGTGLVQDRCGPTGKARYRTEAAAVRALAVIQRDTADEPTPRHRESRAYGPCDGCGGFHLTSQARVA